ncbi:MAG: DUF1189 family protein [Candidatus Omnitrophica bacterium]|nr:DUF1189 family protein [Candidatus Omnitrophota bacterium]
MIQDILRGLYDVRFLAHTISRRSLKHILLVLVLFSVAYGLILGTLYATMIVDFLPAVEREILRHVPAFHIKGGELYSDVSQPYIVTLKNLSGDFFADLDAWAERWSKKGPSDIRTVKTAAKYYLLSAGVQESLFCFVLDTTGTYKQFVSIDQFREVLLLTRTGFYYRSGPNVKEYPFSEAQGREIYFTPDKLKVVLANFPGTIKKALPFLFMLIFLVQFTVRALVMSALSLILASMLKKRLSFKQLFGVAVYAIFPVMILGLIHNFIFGILPFIPVVVYAGYIAGAVIVYGREGGAVLR